MVAESRNTIPKAVSFVNEIMISETVNPERLGVIKASANQAAARFVNTAERVLTKACWSLVIEKL